MLNTTCVCAHVRPPAARRKHQALFLSRERTNIYFENLPAFSFQASHVPELPVRCERVGSVVRGDLPWALASFFYVNRRC